jgi:hypothetical protein
MSASDVAGGRRWLPKSAALVTAAVLAVGGLLYAMPPGYRTPWGTFLPGVRHFAEAYGIGLPPLGAGSLRLSLVGLFAFAWAVYGAGLLAAGRTREPVGRRAWLWAVAPSVLVALIVPPGLSSDVYAYVAHAHLPLLHGLDPYVHSQLEVARFHDPVAPFLEWDSSCPYGPVWLALTLAALAPVGQAPLLVQVLALKLLAAAALVATALGARRLAERLEPGRGGLALFAVALNPMFLVEGPGNGHNDLLLAALLAWGAAFVVEGRVRLGTLLVGAAAGVKIVAAPVVVWVAIQQGRAGRSWRAFLEAAAFGLFPVGLTVVAFWHGAGLGGGLRTYVAHRMGGREQAALLGMAVLGLVAVGLTAWVAARPRPITWLRAWVVFAALLVVLPAGVPFPWYFTWSLGLALALWRRADVAVSIVVLALAMAALLAHAAAA